MTEIPLPSIHAGDQVDGIAGMGADGTAGVLLTLAVPACVPVRAMHDVLAVRADQIFKYGHTAEKDATRALSHFVRDIADATRAIGEDMQFNKGPDRMRRRLVKLGALILATIDRIDNEGDAQ